MEAISEITILQRVEYILKFDETPMSFHVSCLYVLMEDLPKTWCYFKYGILMIAGLVLKTHPLKKFGSPVTILSKG